MVELENLLFDIVKYEQQITYFEINIVNDL